MNIKTVEDLFIHLLSDTYSAEKQLTKALSKLARATSNEKLSQAFQSHLEETQGQIERIDQIVESESGIKLKRMKCVAMEGLIEEANEVIESTEKKRSTRCSAYRRGAKSRALRNRQLRHASHPGRAARL